MNTKVEVVRVPHDHLSAQFVLRVGQARAVALSEGVCLMESFPDSAYLIHDEDGWHVEPASLFDTPAWAIRALRIITDGDSQ